ncbi:ABC-type zinc uptake system zinc chaperone [Shewanella jiangmenensis]|uniref:ABC-type zinc uptake system zinc chaperone n=1 Tax=Shewanella jiangmenensis TaxID=2837387 RepID=UPI0020325D4C|nr:ABC-type zinc uptake system zinc chaperone [Shewanella jiangmenensis]
MHRHLAVWLIAVLAFLSFAASAHSVTHLDDGANSHCTLCIHKHQLNKLLPGTAAPLLPSLLVHEAPDVSLPQWRSAERPTARSRGPPVSPVLH